MDGKIQLKRAQRLLSLKKFLGFWVVLGLLVGLGAKEAKAFSLTSFIKGLLGIGGGVVETSEVRAASLAAKPFPFLSPQDSPDPQFVDLQLIENNALVAAVGPLGSMADIGQDQSYNISTYVVQEGDSLSLIAQTFGVSVATIRWANDLPRNGQIKRGQTLVILPVSGMQHTVAKGDTIASIAKKYGGDPDDIFNFNGLAPGEVLTVGSVIIIPDGELAPAPETSRPQASRPSYVRGGGLEIVGYYLRPINGGTRTQGIHGYNGVDLAQDCGSPIYASAAGAVITARSAGWNVGYGKYVVISHANGTQTLYSHLSSVGVGAGWNVAQGQEIGLIGTTGKSTGCHLHFEVRGAKNPF